MKNINKYIAGIGIAVASLGFSSCIGDLDLLPNDDRVILPTEFSKNPVAYMEKVMGDVYLQFATHGVNNNAAVQGFDGGMSTFQRSAFILEEVPTDETCWTPADTDYGDFQFGIVTSNNRTILGTYSRFMICVAVCNDFIQTVNRGYFNLDNETRQLADEYIRQCKILRSGAYFYLLDCFGNVPYADENTDIGSIPAQLPRAESFKIITKTLEDVVAEYGDGPQTAVYGYVGKQVAQALLVKYYLNAGVYLNGDGENNPHWGDCYRHAENIIAAHRGVGFKGSNSVASGLANHYRQLFGANNDQYALGGSNEVNEIIWVIPQEASNQFNPGSEDPKSLTSWGNGTFMLDAWLGDKSALDEWDCTKTRYNSGDAWKCMAARQQFSQKFDWKNGEYTDCADLRTQEWCAGKENFKITNEVLDQDHFGSNGFLAIKFTNWNVDANGEFDQNDKPAATAQIGTDYPVIRLAEIYLSAAEAMLHGAGDRAKALEYVNYIRERAGLSAWESMTLEQLRDERCRELYTENCRRTDLIRYGQWISGYTWNWKNKVPAGADFDPSFVLYPLPSSIATPAGYTQNQGYN